MLTDSKAKAAKPEAKAYKLSDSGGLYLHVQPNGSKYWRMEYRHLQKEKLLSIGVYPDITLAAARKARDTAKEQLREGLDPSTMKQLQQHQRQKAAEDSFEATANEWHRLRSASWAPITAERQRAILDNDLMPYLGRRPVADLETFELVVCLKRIADRGALETAHKARQILNQVCRYAKQVGLAKHNPAADLVGVLPPQKVSHMAAITTPADFGRLLVDIERYEGSHTIRTALALAPLLFQRPGELCAMEWAEIDIEARQWVIPREKKKERNKTEGDHIVPLSEQATSLLQNIMPVTGHGKYVFPNRSNPKSCIRTETLNKALRNMGYDTRHQQCVHGFRASARTMLDEQLQLRIEYIEQQLAHKVRDPLGNAYNRTKHLPERIAMMQRWADYLDTLKRQTLAGNVIAGQFRGAAGA